MSRTNMNISFKLNIDALALSLVT